MLGEAALTSLSAFALLGLGLVFGLKHATEADHIVAVSTIVSEQRSLLRSATVGALWGVGHTISLIVVGIIVLALRVSVPERVAHWLEFGVALMIIGLGTSALLRVRKGRRRDVHLHQHKHDGVSHVHLHFHEHETEHTGKVSAHSHVVSRIGFKPLLIGAMHGLAGSAALTLLVLTQINSTALGLLYLTVFGIGSILGMLLMSGLIGLPFALSARKFNGVHYGLQAVAGALSLAFGLWYAYQTGIASGLWRTIL
jgi:ABC-type nickel/cobalt efflux system permease component RcnA